ncbi:MAG: helix-turn-helix domain-containing protein [Chitinophagaceae bacterium]|nr:helix-turn-helix domain-containing protein [Chitinophagaceae bacterium]
METMVSAHDRQIARTSLSAIKAKARQLIRKKNRGVNIKINDADITIPQTAFSLLSDILSNMADGKPVSVIPIETEITTQQAANLLHVSRPFIVKLLETGVIPFFKVGRHRRILLKDIRAYEERQQQTRKKQLAFLAKQAQKLNMGY